MPASKSSPPSPAPSGPADVDAYIAAFSDAALRARLQSLREAIRKAAPAAMESISYRIPTFKRNGKALVYFAGWKSHVGLYPISATVQRAFERDLEPYERSRGTIQFPHSKPLPLALIRRMVKFRIQELDTAKQPKKK